MTPQTISSVQFRSEALVLVGASNRKFNSFLLVSFHFHSARCGISWPLPFGKTGDVDIYSQYDSQANNLALCTCVPFIARSLGRRSNVT